MEWALYYLFWFVFGFVAAAIKAIRNQATEATHVPDGEKAGGSIIIDIVLTDGASEAMPTRQHSVSNPNKRPQ